MTGTGCGEGTRAAARRRSRRPVTSGAVAAAVAAVAVAVLLGCAGGAPQRAPAAPPKTPPVPATAAPRAPAQTPAPSTPAPVVADAGRSWCLTYTFNDGEAGQKVPGLDAAGGTRFTRERSFEGGSAAVLSAVRGQENYGRWGGRVVFPEKLRKGDELWWRVRTYWPRGIDYSAEPRLKFLRVHTSAASGENHGYDDVYINPPGSDVPFQFIYEGEQKWTPLGGRDEAIVPDTWETYEYYVKLDDVPVAEGGQARVRFWKDGTLIRDITDRKTLKCPDDLADCALLFTYWNSSPWTGQITFAQGGPFERGELVTAEAHPDRAFRIEKAVADAIFLVDPERDWKKRVKPFGALKPGERLTGKTSGHTCVIAEVLHTHPVMDITMYADDMVLTTAVPRGRDARGNPCIGAAAARP